MARLKRYHCPKSFYHVMLRGNDGQDIFFSENDRYTMYFLLQEGVENYGHQIHAFCLMKNHIHLLIQVGEVPLSKIMQNLGSRYTQKINRRYDRVGHLFQGRFKSILIEDEVYFTRLLRYIHRNPVRAHITQTPENYIWSSHNTYLFRNSMEWVTIDYGLSKFGIDLNDSLTRYSAFILKAEAEEELNELRSNFMDGQVLGSKNFLDNIRNQKVTNLWSSISLEIILKTVCDDLAIDKNELFLPTKSRRASFARAIVCMIANKNGKIPIEQIALLMNRDSSTISSLLARFSVKIRNSIDLKNLCEKITRKIFQIAELQT